ncbi:pilus assembly protein PilM [Erwinia tracheiphila]|uniref:Pilus assembly protein n=1 Tax=Erwinia tracheiphila TaxID=65700 RepID=A0A345CX59_9GAMM|nr:pilus assembly protein PilM [Erwinia tracheiphila]AXF78026.1 pilus assembly protein [Erwinia tracheiphila]UIA83260.1 pilus assembly protein PilM [Erwinia tracheiphila]UIA91839.1 pilus assembly protein PilM [Erwinia tracheiphila]
MAFKTWQVGLDIQNGQMCALGILRRRGGWQLRHWWQHALPKDTLIHGHLQQSGVLKTILQRWRKQLPSRISLRVGFPPQLVLQRKIDMPDRHLREPCCASYISAAAKRFFPVEPETLTLDYRQPELHDNQLWLTATRREALKSWTDLLQEADLYPQVMELTPAALCALAKHMLLTPGSALIHRLEDHWLWYCVKQQPSWGWCSLEDAPVFRILRQKYLSDQVSFHYSSMTATCLPEDSQWLNPFRVLAHQQPPLPMMPGAFSVAAGLALRPGDA